MRGLITVTFGLIAIVAVVIWLRRTYPPKFRIEGINYTTETVTYKFGSQTKTNDSAESGVWLVKYTNSGGGVGELKLFRDKKFVKDLATIDFINSKYKIL